MAGGEHGLDRDREARLLPTGPDLKPSVTMARRAGQGGDGATARRPSRRRGRSEQRDRGHGHRSRQMRETRIVAKVEIRGCQEPGHSHQVLVLERSHRKRKEIPQSSRDLAICRPDDEHGRDPPVLQSRDQLGQQGRCAALMRASAARMDHRTRFSLRRAHRPEAPPALLGHFHRKSQCFPRAGACLE